MNSIGRAVLGLMLMIIIGFSTLVKAQTVEQHTANSSSPTASAAQLAEPVPVPTPSDLSVRHYQSGIWLWIVSSVWSVLLPGVVLFSGLSARMRTLANGWSRLWYPRLVIYFLLFGAVLFAANLPLNFYIGFVRPHEYGLTTQAFSKWLQDDIIGFGISSVGAALFLWIPYWLIARTRARWWLYSGFAGIPIIIFVTLIQPILIDPLFDHFGRMQDSALEARVLSLAHRAGIDLARVYQVDKSVDTKELNAYVTGIGPSARVVLWDTSIKALSPGELSTVVGHEIGHYVLGHVKQGMVVACAALLLVLWLVDLSAGAVLSRVAQRTGVITLADVASLPLLMLLAEIFVFLMTPPLLMLSRHYEHEADRFGLELTHDNRDCALVFVTFMRDDLSYPTPSPVMEFFRSSHPSAAERIEFCNSYHPWREGKAGRYSRFIAPGP